MTLSAVRHYFPTLGGSHIMALGNTMLLFQQFVIVVYRYNNTTFEYAKAIK